MRVSVIVPTRNRCDMLGRSVRSVFLQEGLDSEPEVIIVDDASTDDTEACVETLRKDFPELTYVRHAENVGRSANRNSGIVRSQGEIIFLVDDDVELDPHYIAAVLECFARNQGQRVAVIGNMTFAEELVEGSNFGQYVQSRYLSRRSARELKDIDLDDLMPKFFDTAVAVIRRDDLMGVGMLDESFRYYGGEDEYLGYALWRSGVRLVFAADAWATHLRTPTLDSYKRRYREYGASSLRVMLSKCPDYIRHQVPSLLLPLVDRIQAEEMPEEAKAQLETCGFKERVGGAALHLALNPVCVYLLEKWAEKTDRAPALYSQGAIRLLQLAWLMQGLRKSVAGLSDQSGHV